MDLSILKKQTLKNKIFISIGLIILVAAGTIYFIILPAMRDIKKMGDEIEAQMVDLELKYQKGQSLKRLKETLQKIEPQLAKLDEILIERTKALAFITSLEKVAEQNNATQKINLITDQNKNLTGSQKIPLQLAVTCEFNKCYNYLIDLEKLNYYINIKSLEFNSSGGGGPGTINLLIFADTYWR